MADLVTGKQKRNSYAFGVYEKLIRDWLKNKTKLEKISKPKKGFAA